MICLDLTTDQVNSCQVANAWKTYSDQQYHESLAVMVPQLPKGVVQHCLNPMIEIMTRRQMPLAFFKDKHNIPVFEERKPKKDNRAKHGHAQEPMSKRSRQQDTNTAYA